MILPVSDSIKIVKSSSNNQGTNWRANLKKKWIILKTDREILAWSQLAFAFNRPKAVEHKNISFLGLCMIMQRDSDDQLVSSVFRRGQKGRDRGREGRREGRRKEDKERGRVKEGR